MRRLASPALFLAIFLIAMPVYAERFQSYEERNEKPPDKYDPDITGEISNLESHLRDNVSCGGWINEGEQEVMERGVVTEAYGAPGRSPKDGNSFTNLPSGLSERDPFVYPSEAYGYASACSIYDSRYNPDQLCLIGPQNATPQECKDLYHHLLDLAQTPPPTFMCGDPALPHVNFTRKRCFDFTETCTGEECRCGRSMTIRDYGTPVGAVITINRGPTLEQRKLTPDPSDDQCKPEFAEYNPSCYYLIDGDGNYILVLNQPLKYEVDIPSFFRHYGPISDHEAIPQEAHEKGFPVVSEGQEQKVASDCYEYYIEKDARVKVAPAWNARCELYETHDSDGDPPEWTENPQKTWIEPNTNMSPYTAEEMNPPRPEREVDAPWIADTETSMALLDVQGEYEPHESIAPNDLPSYLNAAPESKVIASRARNFGRADSFDNATDPTKPSEYPGTDSLEHRAVSRWWDEQQAKLKDISRIPGIHLILPARYGVGLDINDPILQYATKVIPKPNGVVELELRAGDDVLGSVLSSLQHSLLLVPKQVSVPIVVPVVSETEIDVLIHDWQQWGIKYHQEGAVEELVTRFEEYRDQVRNVRLLRGALASYLKDVLGVQREIRGFFAEWYLANAQALQSFSQESDERDRVLTKWRDIMKEFIRLHDRCELKWCNNARYTLPIYSLLDTWLPGRPDLVKILSDSRYSLRDIPWSQSPDVVADFSVLKLPTEEFFLPSLEVTQIRINLPLPPGGPGSVPSPDDLPDIPMIDPASLVPDATIFASYDPPEVDTPALDDRHYVSGSTGTNDYDAVLARLVSIETIVTSAADKYCGFYNSVEGEDDQPRKIVHTEFDLRERITRLFARRAPLWQQDYQGRVERIGTPVPKCVDDTLCDKLYPEQTKSFEWQVNAPKDSAATITPSYQTVRDQVLPEDEEHNPFTVPLKVIKRYLFPKMDPAPQSPPLDVHLSPPPPPPENTSSTSS